MNDFTWNISASSCIFHQSHPCHICLVSGKPGFVLTPVGCKPRNVLLWDGCSVYYSYMIFVKKQFMFTAQLDIVNSITIKYMYVVQLTARWNIFLCTGVEHQMVLHYKKLWHNLNSYNQYMDSCMFFTPSNVKWFSQTNQLFIHMDSSCFHLLVVIHLSLTVLYQQSTKSQHHLKSVVFQQLFLSVPDKICPFLRNLIKYCRWAW